MATMLCSSISRGQTNDAADLVGFERGEGDGGRFLADGRGHGDGAEGRTGAHARRAGGAHADRVRGHAAADDAELGDELADFAAVFGWERDVAGGEGGFWWRCRGRRGRS